MANNVQLALYDLSRGMAKALSMSFLGKQIDGIWHTGIIVYGKEYFFGGGLQSMPHESFVAMHGGMRPTEYIILGATDLPQDLFEDFNHEINPRFTPQTYDLMKHNCNNYTDEAAKFLLGKGIPEYIINLPNEVLNSPMGGMLRPVLEQMTVQMNGADPYAALHQEAAQHNTGSSTPTVSATISAAATPTTATQPTPAPAAAIPAGTASRGSTPGRAGGFPILDKHIKPLVGSDTAKAAGNVAARLKAFGSGDNKLLSEAEASTLDALPASLAAAKSTPVTPGGFPLMQRIIRKGSGWPEKAEFLALVLLSLMVLHNADGPGMESAMAEVAARVQVDGDLTAQSLSIALCTAANTFGTPMGCKYMVRADVIPGWLDVTLRGLQHTRGEVRQMASAVLNNMSLVLATSIANVTHDSEMSDEATQILFGVLDGLMEEKSQMVALRRLLAAGRLIRKMGVAAVTLVNEVGLREQVEGFRDSSPEGEAKSAASEVSRLLGST